MISPIVHQRGETNTTSKSLLRRTLAGVLTLLLVFFGGATAAFAHDSVTGTSPANGATVDTVPEKIEVSMSNVPAVIGSEVQVLDDSGTNWAVGDVDVLDRVASQAVKPGAPAGKYTVKWRLVSSDSHPVEGEFTFTATAASTGSTVPGAGTSVSIQPQPEAAPEKTADTSTVPWSVIGLVVVLVGLVVALLVVARRRLTKED